MKISLIINGAPTEVDVWSGASLLAALRADAGFMGTKNACEQGECGSCSILLNGTLVCSCLVLAAQAQDCEITTIESLAHGGELHPIQSALIDAGGVQCGFCTPGVIMATLDLFNRNLSPTEDEIRAALAGNLCRCTGYGRIIEAVKMAAAVWA